MVWTWKARDHLAFSEWSDLTPAAHVGLAHLDIGGHDYWDINHLNSVADDGDGLIVSSRHLDAVYRIDKSDGSVDWKLGGTPTARSIQVAGADRYPLLNSQHDARRLPNGHITVFDNGTEGSADPAGAGGGRGPGRAHRRRWCVRSRTRGCRPHRAAAAPGPSGPAASRSRGVAPACSPRPTPPGYPVLSLDLGASLFSYRVVPVAPGAVARTTLQDGMDAMFPRPVGG